jgi:hypothetical protein
MPTTPISSPGASSITVPYKELGVEHGLETGADERGPWETKPYLVAWSDRFTFANQMLGLSTQSGSSGSGSWSRSTPYQHPETPSMVATGVRLIGADTWVPNSTPIAYINCKLLVSFRTPQWPYLNADDPFGFNMLSQDPAEIPYLLWASQEIDFTSERILVPNRTLRFKSDLKKINTPYAVKVAIQTMSLVYHRYPTLPTPFLRQYVDSINDSVFLQCPRGTVYLEGARTTREFNFNGSAAQKLQMVFKYRQYDWNKTLREDGFTWDAVEDSAGSGTQPFTYRNFRQLLF